MVVRLEFFFSKNYIVRSIFVLQGTHDTTDFSLTDNKTNLCEEKLTVDYQVRSDMHLSVFRSRF